MLFVWIIIIYKFKYNLMYQEILSKVEKASNKRFVKLLAVSKGQSVEKILQVYQCGQRDFGESYVEELLEKHSVLPKDIHWHFIGHL